MAVIPAELLQDAPSFTEFLAFYTKSQAEWKRQQEEWQRQQKELQEERERQQKERQEERERQQKELQEERERQQKEERRRQEERERQQKEEKRRQEEWEQQQKKSHAEWERIQAALAAQMAETSRKVAALSENVGGLNRSVGELIETLIAARLWEKFPEYGLQRAYRRLPIYDEHNVPKTDIDILLVNTEWAMAVEVKREADRGDVERHIERMARILKYPPGLIPPGVKLLGAIAGGVVGADAGDYAHQCGFFVLELTGETVSRIPEPVGFKPREWR
jgi:hypothetical protein